MNPTLHRYIKSAPSKTLRVWKKIQTIKVQLNDSHLSSPSDGLSNTFFHSEKWPQVDKGQERIGEEEHVFTANTKNKRRKLIGWVYAWKAKFYVIAYIRSGQIAPQVTGRSKVLFFYAIPSADRAWTRKSLFSLPPSQDYYVRSFLIEFIVVVWCRYLQESFDAWTRKQI